MHIRAAVRADGRPEYLQAIADIFTAFPAHGENHNRLTK